MAASLLIEDESGTYSGRIRHPHNGYYAGDFALGQRPLAVVTASANSTTSEGWIGALDQLAALSPNSGHRTGTPLPTR